MLNISEKLHLYEFEDGETHFILAESKKSAEKWYREEYVDKYILEEGYSIKEISKDTDLKICNIDEDKDFYNIINRYKLKDEYVDSLPIWLFIKWDILESELHEEDYVLPRLIASSVY